MAQVSGDPAELRRFARDLNRFNNDMQTLVTGIHGRLVQLGNTWRDQEHRKFAENFDATMKVLKRFVEESNEHVQFLQRKASHLEQYLG